MAVFRDIEIDWNGKSYSVTPSNRVLRRIEGEGISLTHMISRIADGQPPISETCFVMSELLKTAGASVSEDEIYGEVMIALSNGDEQAFANMAVAIVEAISPQGLEGKKQDAPDKKPQRKAGGKSKE